MGTLSPLPLPTFEKVGQNFYEKLRFTNRKWIFIENITFFTLFDYFVEVIFQCLHFLQLDKLL